MQKMGPTLGPNGRQKLLDFCRRILLSCRLPSGLRSLNLSPLRQNLLQHGQQESNSLADGFGISS